MPSSPNRTHKLNQDERSTHSPRGVRQKVLHSISQLNLVVAHAVHPHLWGGEEDTGRRTLGGAGQGRPGLATRWGPGRWGGSDGATRGGRRGRAAAREASEGGLQVQPHSSAVHAHLARGVWRHQPLPRVPAVGGGAAPAAQQPWGALNQQAAAAVAAAATGCVAQPPNPRVLLASSPSAPGMCAGGPMLPSYMPCSAHQRGW